jgi:hypothetical protein
VHKCVYNTFVPINSTKTHEEKNKMKGEISNSTVIAGDFNTLLFLMNGTMRQKISKETEQYRLPSKILYFLKREKK